MKNFIIGVFVGVFMTAGTGLFLFVKHNKSQARVHMSAMKDLHRFHGKQAPRMTPVSHKAKTHFKKNESKNNNRKPEHVSKNPVITPGVEMESGVIEDMAGTNKKDDSKASVKEDDEEEELIIR